MAYDFDKAVPVPTSVERVGVNIELLKAMQPGESKWWSEDDAKKATRFYRVAKKLGIPIIIRKVGDKDPRGAGVRMWRADSGIVVDGDPLAAAAAEAARSVAAPKKVSTPKAAKKTAQKGNSGGKKALPKTAPASARAKKSKRVAARS